jgi:NADPH:quinone reductase-like Zn-dependent oxidoreductase
LRKRSEQSLFVREVGLERGVDRGLSLGPPGGLDGLSIEEIEMPSPGPGNAIVQVHAAALTRDELDWPADRLPATPSYELSGVVSAVGPDVTSFAAGDEVYAMTSFGRDGVAAEYALVGASELVPKPPALGHLDAAALPLAGLSACQGLFDRGRLQSGQRVLVTGAAGGVGHIATQLARHAGAHVIGMASAGRASAATEFGAHEVIQGFDELSEPVDLVFDTRGGEALERSPVVIVWGGRLVSVAEEPPAVAGIEAVYFVVQHSTKQLGELAALVEAGALRPAVDSVFPLAEARAAFERTLARGKRGKVVLQVAEG